MHCRFEFTGNAFRCESGLAREEAGTGKTTHKLDSSPNNPTAPCGFKVFRGGYVSNRGEQSLLKQSTLLMLAVAIAGVVTGFVSGAQSILFDGFFSLIATRRCSPLSSSRISSTSATVIGGSNQR
jgi:hypothetical protein